MKKFLTFIIGLFLTNSSLSQNLVPNPGFEDIYSCPSSISQLDTAIGWLTPSLGTPDLFYDCPGSGLPVGWFGYQMPHGGLGYSGIGLGAGNSREYIGVPLMDTLDNGKCYNLSFYVSTAHYRFTTDDIHGYFSDSIFQQHPTVNELQVTPQVINTPGNFPDTTSWILVTGDFVATGGEKYLVIGNFYNNSASSFISVDTNATNNTCYIYIDDVSVTEITCVGINEINMSWNLFPNPTTSNVSFETNNNQLLELTIYDALGRALKTIPFQKKGEVNLSDLSSGIYYYSLEDKSSVIKTGKIIKL